MTGAHPVHQTFEGDGFVVCSFCPRPFDFGEDAVPAPYFHSNVWTDEVKIEAEALRGHRIRDPVPGLVTGTLLAPRATFARLGSFADQRHAYALDWALRLKQAGLAYEVLDEVLLVRRYHARNMSREGADSRDEVLALLKRNLDARRGG